MRRDGLFATAVAVAVLASALLDPGGDADAATVAVGPVSGGFVKTRPCPAVSCTFVNTGLGGQGGNLVAPISGTIVTFTVTGATSGTYRLRTLNSPGALPTFEGWSEPKSTIGAPSGIFSTALPVTAGQAIGLTVSAGAEVGFLQRVGSSIEWQTEQPQVGLAIGESISHNEETADFQAVILPPPTISGLENTVGSAAGGTAVTLTGANLQDVTEVRFGNETAWPVRSAGTERLIAIAPTLSEPIRKAKAVPVTVTTKAGSATAATPFTYLPLPVRNCVVPQLKGKTLKAAKRALLKARCRPGKVRKKQGATPRTGRVAAQGSKPGAKLPLHARVGLTLTPPRLS